MYTYENWGKSYGNYYLFIFEDTSLFIKYDGYRRKDKELTTCVDNK